MRANSGGDALRFLGLARRAGATVCGIDAVRRAVRQGEARLVLLAEDASRVQLDKVLRTAEARRVPQAYLGDRAALGEAVGRGPVSAVGVTESSFASGLRQRLGASAGPGRTQGSE